MMWDKTEFHCRDPDGIYFQFLIGSEWRKEQVGVTTKTTWQSLPTSFGAHQSQIGNVKPTEIFIDKWRNKWAHLTERDSFIGTLRPRQTGRIRAEALDVLAV